MTDQQKRDIKKQSQEVLTGLMACTNDFGSFMVDSMKTASELIVTSANRSAATVSADATKIEVVTTPAAAITPAVAAEKTEEVKKEEVTAKPAVEPVAAEAEEAPEAPISYESCNDVDALRAMLVTKDEELHLNELRIKSLQETKATLISTINNSAQKLIPAAIAAKDATIADLKQGVVEAKGAITAMEDEIAALNSSKDEAAEANKLALAKMEEDTKAALAQKDEVIATKEQELAAKAEEISQKDELLAQKDAEIAAKVEELSRKDEEISRKEQEIAAKLEQLAEKERELASRDEEIEANHTCIKSLEADIADKMEKLDGIECPLKHLQTYLAVREAKIASLEAQLSPDQVAKATEAAESALASEPQDERVDETPSSAEPAETAPETEQFIGNVDASKGEADATYSTDSSTKVAELAASADPTEPVVEDARDDSAVIAV